MHKITITFTMIVNPHPDDLTEDDKQQCLDRDVELIKRLPLEHLDIFGWREIEVKGEIV